jgi:hypothetical protein
MGIDAWMMYVADPILLLEKPVYVASACSDSDDATVIGPE